jgi:hypothetical protein
VRRGSSYSLTHLTNEKMLAVNTSRPANEKKTMGSPINSAMNSTNGPMRTSAAPASRYWQDLSRIEYAVLASPDHIPEGWGRATRKGGQFDLDAVSGSGPGGLT